MTEYRVPPAFLEHYADPTNGWDADMFGICSSARATVKRLRNAGVA